MIDFNAALTQDPASTPPPARHGRTPRSKELASPEAASLAAPDPFDLAPVKVRLGQYTTGIDRMSKEAAELVVDSDESNVLAVEMAGQAKKLNRSIETARKSIVEPHDAFVKSVNRLAKGFQSTLSAIEAGLKLKIGAHARKKELERQEIERKAREEAERLNKAIEEEAKAKGLDVPEAIPAPVIPKGETITRTAEGSTSLKKVWKFEVADATAVPRDFLTVDEAKIRQAVKDGVREIPGVNIYEDTQVALRV